MFIVLDGLDGCGKNTIKALLSSALRNKGVNTLLTSDLYDTALGLEVKRILLEADVTLDKEACLLMLTAARRQNVMQNILPALQKGDAVICDRFTDSTYAYNVCGFDGSRDFFHKHCERMPLEPDFSFILDVPLEVSRARILERGNPDRIERMNTDFFQKVRNGYLERSTLKNRYLIDANQRKEDVIADITKVLFA